MSNSNYLWDIILEKLKEELNSEVYSTWIIPNTIEDVDMINRTITINSSNPLISDYLKNIFDAKFKNILQTYTSLDFKIFYTYSGGPKLMNNDFASQQVVEEKPAKNTFESNILKKFNSSNEPAKQSFSRDYVNDFYTAPKPTEGLTPSKKNPSLQKHFIFDNFVVGEGSKYAFNLAYSTTLAPGEHNPVFIYGGSGLGKTHLLHAIGNEMEKNYPHFKIMWVTSEQFFNDFIESFGKGSENKQKSEEFRQKYRSVDVLLIDDIQFWANKKAMQDAFFHTFNELYMEQKQIVLISDREPSELDGLDDRLVSRFESGVVADITPPDYETRMAIIMSKSEAMGLNLDNSVTSYIAGSVSSNVRQIEGVLKSVKVLVNSGTPATLSNVEEHIKHMVKTVTKSISPEDIIHITADFYKVSVDDILSSKRVKEVVTPRMVAIYLCRDLTDLSLPAIGNVFNKDHSSIHYSISRVTSMINENKNEITSQIESIKNKLKK